MQTDCELISMNALSAGFVITGSSASWRGAKCGKVAERLVRGQFANPVVVLDEVEKATGSSQSDPLAALYQLLEPETSCAFRDEFIDVDIDAIADLLGTDGQFHRRHPAPAAEPHGRVRSPAPTPEQAAGIAQRIYAGLLRELNLTAFDPLLGEAVLDRLAGVSPRDLRKTLLDGLGYAVADGRAHVVAEDIRLKRRRARGGSGSEPFPTPPRLDLLHVEATSASRLLDVQAPLRVSASFPLPVAPDGLGVRMSTARSPRWC